MSHTATAARATGPARAGALAFTLTRAFTLALAAIALAAPRAAAQGSPTQDARARAVDALFAHHDTAPSPGLAIAVVEDGRVVLRRGYGMADLEHRVRIGPETVFDAASLSKQVTGLAIAMLAEEGRLRLDDAVTRYLPELVGLGRPVTIRQLLHHTSGIRDWPGTLSVAGWHFEDVISFEQILGMAGRQRSLNFAPGAEYLYSNTGYNVLAEVVQRVTGRSFRAWTDERLFRPLGMTRSRFRDDHREVITDRAFGYVRSPSGAFLHVPNNLTALGSSSMFTSVDDLARWMLNFDDARVGGAAALRAMRTPDTLNDGRRNQYAFGVNATTHRGAPLVGHSGSWAAFRAHLAYLPEQRLGVVILANAGWLDATAATLRVLDVYLGDRLPAATAATTDAAPARPAVVPRATLERYVGRYRLGPGWYTQVTVDSAGGLWTRATNESAFPMTARTDSAFWVQAYGASMTFRRDATGRITHLEYRGQRAPRVADGAGRGAPRVADVAGRYESAELGTWYQVTVAGDSVTIHHPRHGSSPLVPVLDEELGSPRWWFMRSVVFERDREGRVTGMVVNGDQRSRDIRFRKVAGR